MSSAEKPDAFRYDFTPREFAYFLFSKKNCPRCSCRMVQHKEFEVVPGSTFNTRHHAVFRPNARVKHYIYTYSCPSCGAKFSLQELADKKR